MDSNSLTNKVYKVLILKDFMGFFDKIKSAGKNVVTGISKTIEKTQIKSRANSEAYQVKRKILLNLSLNELKSLAYLMGLGRLEYKTYFDDKTGGMSERKIKLNKFDYVDNIAKKPYSELVLKLKHLHKSSLADEMEREVSFIEKKRDEEKNNISKEISQEEREKSHDALLSAILKTIVEEIVAVNPERCKKESNYQIELKGALKVAVKKEFSKSKVSVEMEYPTKTGKRIDIMIQIDNYRIGIETKYNLGSSGQFQRAVGQALEYSNFLDALIIVQYETLEDEVGLNNLKELSKLITIPLRVIANSVPKI